MAEKFDLNDLIFMHKTIYGLLPIVIANYLTFLQGSLDFAEPILTICHSYPFAPSSPSNAFANSFFFRTHCKWNDLPRDIREVYCLVEFKRKVASFQLLAISLPSARGPILYCRAGLPAHWTLLGSL